MNKGLKLTRLVVVALVIAAIGLYVVYLLGTFIVPNWHWALQLLVGNVAITGVSFVVSKLLPGMYEKYTKLNMKWSARLLNRVTGETVMATEIVKSTTPDGHDAFEIKFK